MADIITYPENGIYYDDDDVAAYLATRTSGVYSADEDFAVSPAGELSVTVSAGQAWVRPERFKGRSITMKQSTTLTLTAADSTRSRIDRVVLRYDAAARQTALLVLEGTPNSAGPTAPEITRTALIYDLCLAEIARPAGSTEITTADITDTRADETVCGVMRDGVTGIPTGDLIRQFQAVIAALRGEAADKLGYYPVGSIYMTVASTSPATLFGGTWEEIASDRVLMGASSAHAAGTTAEAGLPGIVGTFQTLSLDSPSTSGAFSYKSQSRTGYVGDGSSTVWKGQLSLNAASSSAVYGKSDTVQPAAYYVHIWVRTA